MISTSPRYTVEQTGEGWDVVDREKGVSVGTCPTEKEALATAQRTGALMDANVKRAAAAEFKRELAQLNRRDSAHRLADLLAQDTHGPLDGMPIAAALLAVKGVGRQRASHIMRAANVTALSRRTRDLTPRQREVVSRALRMYADRAETCL